MTYPPPSSGQPSYPPPVDPYDSPQHTQPVFDQPAYGQPAYPPPGYGPPAQGHPGYSPPVQDQHGYGPPVQDQHGYGPPVHGQPVYGQPGFQVAPPSPRRSRTTTITLIAAIMALALVVGGVAVLYLIGERFSQDRREGVVLGGSTGASPSETAGTAKDNISIREPETLNGHAKIQAEELSSLTAGLEKELEGYPGAANAFGAVYGSLADKKMIAALAAEVDIDDPQRMVDTVFQSFSAKNALTGVAPASTGTLGGVAQCGSSVIGKEDVAICGWADEGSVGMFVFFYETAVNVKGDFPDMRAEIETKR